MRLSLARVDPTRPHLLTAPFDLDDWAPLGHGATALTYSGTLSSGARVIVKELFPVGATRTPTGLVKLPFAMRGVLDVAFEREALNLAALENLHIPKFYRQMSDGPNRYLIVEQVEGENLGNWFARLSRRDRGAICGRALTNCFADLADTLAWLELKNLTHGDIAPPNIILRGGHCPVIVDFGSAFSSFDPHWTRVVTHLRYRLPGDIRGKEGWRRVDLFGLCASFYMLLTGRPPLSQSGEPEASLADFFERFPSRMIDGTSRLVAAIDMGLSTTADVTIPSCNAASLAQLVRTGESPTSRAIGRESKSFWGVEKDERQMPLRYQRCILQSFDTPRYREDDRKWLLMRSGEPLITPMTQKIALARAEALLALCFGREILVPAGQIADSPGFQAIFTEIMAAYLPRRAEIKASLASQGMPEWRPFRLGLEKPQTKDYAGFTRAYEYTGAPLVLMEMAGEDMYREEATRKLLERAISLFNQDEFDELGTLMLDNAKREDYGEFARTVKGYFDESASVIADKDTPQIGTSEYARLFQARLNQEDLVGIDPGEVEQILGSVERIEAILKEKGFAGFRGNWYVFRKDFGSSWQLARAYLDFRLFMNLSRLYEIDHPILVSQAIEANRYDHSLMLGPRFRSDADGSLERDARLLKLAGRLVNRVKWNDVFDMFLDSRFVKNLKKMNQFYFDSDPDSAEDYQDLVRAHGAFLGRHATDFLDVDPAEGKIAPAGDPTNSDGELVVDAIDGTMLVSNDPAEAAEVYESAMEGMGPMDKAFAMAAIAPLDCKGAFNVGQDGADYMLNYYFKPYRFALSRGL